MGRSSITVTKTVDVDIDVDIDVELDDFDDKELVDEIKSRGYLVIDQTDKKDSNMILWKLRQSYITDTPENFRKFLELTFLNMDMPA